MLMDINSERACPQSTLVLDSLYAMEWLHAPLPFKRSLVMMMERAKRPLRPAAGRIIPLSLDTFVTVSAIDGQHSLISTSFFK
jgi:hypothetical protein